MRGKSIALLVLALGCGLVASLGITQVMAKRGGDATPTDTQPVYVAVKDIPPNAPITPDMVKTEDWPKDRVPPGALVRKEDIEGRRPRTVLYAGAAILDPQLLKPGDDEGGYDRLIPKGYRVSTVQVDSVAITGGLLLPGSRVDIQLFVNANPTLGIGQTLTRVILQDIKVFAVNDVVNVQSQNQNSPEGPKSIQGRTVSLLVLPDQANIITTAQQMGTIRLILRGPDDEQQVKTLDVIPSELLGTNGGAKREKEQATPGSKDNGFKKYLEMLRAMMAAQAKNKPDEKTPDRKIWPIRLIKGAEINMVELEGVDSVSSSASEGGLWKVNGLTMNTPKPAPSLPAIEPIKPPPATGNSEIPGPPFSPKGTLVPMIPDISNPMKPGPG